MTVFSFSDLAFLAVVAGYTPTDTDAAAYITAVETADGQALEPGVRRAIDEFVIGCKADGIWNAIKASCILAGARTLNGALVPLVGAAPTNFNFVSGDYNRKTGLVGNGNGLGSGTKYLNSNRAGNADPQNNRHVSAYVSTVATYVMIGSGSSTGRTQLGEGSVRLASDSPIGGGVISSGTFTGGSRESASTMIRRINGASVSASVNSETPPSLNYAVFARNTSTGIDFYADHRLAFYSIGESLNLALLDARVTALMYGIQKTLLEGDFDIDAAAYISRVETADGQDLEPAVRTAINDFVVGCKADGIWSALKASCILAGARTLNGCLVPLVGTAPTNVNFVAGDYNRKTGLAGNQANKYLDTNRNSNADPQNNHSQGVFVNTAPTASGAYIGSGGGTATGTTHIGVDFTQQFAFFRSRSVTPVLRSSANTATGFFGSSRSSSSEFSVRVSGTTTTHAVTSENTATGNVYVFGRNVSNALNLPTSARLRFYHIGESLDLALLDARVTTLINAIAAAIP